MTTDNKQHAAASIQVLLGRRFGTTWAWDVDGRLIPLTVVQVGTNVVIQVRTEKVDGYSVIQLGLSEIPAHKATKLMAGHFAKADVEPHRHLTEVCTFAADNYEFGQELQATASEAGQAVDVSDSIKDKDFTGVMKRYGLADVPASHGAHRNHRKLDLIGACVTSGRIFKGLRMAGRMGNVRCTVQNLKIQAVDAEKDLLLIGGVIPGPKNGMVLVRSPVKDT